MKQRADLYALGL